MAKSSTEKVEKPTPPPPAYPLREALDVRERDGHTEFVVVVYGDGLCEEHVVATTRSGITAPEVGNQYRVAALRKSVKPLMGQAPMGGDNVLPKGKA